MIIKSKKDTYANFVYDNNNLEEVSSYKYLGIDIHHKINWNYSIEKRINGGWKAYFDLENNCKAANLVMWDKKKLLFETLVTPICMGARFGVSASLEDLGGRLSKSRSVL